jgi:hypothetical protein
LEEESPNVAGLQVAQRMPRRRSMIATRPKISAGVGAPSWVIDAEDADRGPPAALKRGGVPQ